MCIPATGATIEDGGALGPSKWITVTLTPTPLFVEEYVGEKCEAFDKDCPACQAWKQFETTGTIDVLIDNEQLCRALLGLSAEV